MLCWADVCQAGGFGGDARGKADQAKARGVSVLLIEQKLTIAMAISDRVQVMGHGSIVFQGTPEELKADTYTRKEWLEV